jgi:hypothetical protein
MATGGSRRHVARAGRDRPRQPCAEHVHDLPVGGGVGVGRQDASPVVLGAREAGPSGHWKLWLERDPRVMDHDKSFMNRDMTFMDRNPAIAYRNPAIAYRNPTIAYRNPTIAYRNPTIAYRNPTIAYRNPAIAYRNPAIAYRNPTIAYHDRLLHVPRTYATHDAPRPTRPAPPSFGRIAHVSALNRLFVRTQDGSCRRRRKFGGGSVDCAVIWAS